MTPYPKLEPQYEIIETIKVFVLNVLLWILFFFVMIYCAFEWCWIRVRRPH